MAVQRQPPPKESLCSLAEAAPQEKTDLCPLVCFVRPLLQRVQLHSTRLKLQLSNLQALLQLHHLRCEIIRRGPVVAAAILCDVQQSQPAAAKLPP